LLAPLAACSTNGGSDGRLTVVASFYPLAEIAAQIGGTHVQVVNVTPAGVEPHDYELTTDDVDNIDDADLVLYVGAGFQPAIERVVERRDGTSVDLAAGLLGDEEDPHFWLDPDLMAKAVEKARVAMGRADGGHATDFDTKAGEFVSRLNALSSEYASGLLDCARREIVTAHAAFSYLAKRYGLTQRAISGVSPEAEPSPQHLSELSELIRRDGVTTVFYEELVPRDFADTLARDAGVKTAVLNPLEALTEKEAAAGEDYLSVMRDNLRALTDALDCTPGT
jgi:zinc transport system substrate-binding protein